LRSLAFVPAIRWESPHYRRAGSFLHPRLKALVRAAAETGSGASGSFHCRRHCSVGSGNFSLRFAASYFALPATLGPIDNELVFDDPTVSPSQFFKVGTEIDAKVGVFDFTVNYGITRDIEATFTLTWGVKALIVSAPGTGFTAPPTITFTGGGTERRDRAARDHPRDPVVLSSRVRL
jgi:hypothetical protein